MMSNLQCKKKKIEQILFFNYCPLQIWTLTICNQDISKTIKARIFKHGLLIQDDGTSPSTGVGLGSPLAV